MTDFRKALAWTAIPIVTLSIVSTAGAGYGVSGDNFWVGFYLAWYVAAGLWVAAAIAPIRGFCIVPAMWAVQRHSGSGIRFADG